MKPKKWTRLNVALPYGTTTVDTGITPNIRGTFCEKITNPKRKFDARSFRWITSGHAKILIGCPKGKWQPRKQHCTVGTKAYVILTPAKGKRCPVGSKRITKG